jgi:glycosyltransferase involved in cell wall biosynthesis
MEALGYQDKISYIPHTVDLGKFTKISDEEKQEAKKSLFGDEDTFVFFWNGKNMLRKQPELMLDLFAQFKQQVEAKMNAASDTGEEPPVRKPVLLMKTAVSNGANNLHEVMALFNLGEKDVKILDMDMSEEALILLYNLADVTCNTSFAEGFGLPILESLACSTPVIAPLTGGIPEQMLGKDVSNGHAIPIAAQCLISGKPTTAIYQDFFAIKDFVDAMIDLYHLKAEILSGLGNISRTHVEENFPESHLDKWDEVFTKVIGF